MPNGSPIVITADMKRKAKANLELKLKELEL